MSEVDERVRSRMVAHGFPAGLLPQGITADSFDESTGAFEVTMARKVERTIGGFPVRYGLKVTGIIQQGEIRSLTGVKAKRMLWIAISAIDAPDGEDLTFRVGPVRQPIPRSAFG